MIYFFLKELCGFNFMTDLTKKIIGWNKINRKTKPQDTKTFYILEY